MNKKNILLIISDQHRQDAVSFTGNDRVKTPHLDRLFQKGVHFDRAVTPAPLCGPARTSLFTSLYPHQAKGILEEEGLQARDNLKCGGPTDMMLNTTCLQEPPLLTQPFKSQGYYTAYAGKWHLGSRSIGRWFEDFRGHKDQQYIDWLEEKGLPPEGWSLNDREVRSPRTPPMSIPRTKQSPVGSGDFNDAWIADIALDYLRGRPQGRPFFLTCGFNGPHPPFMIPEPWYSLYDPEDFPEPDNFHPPAGEPACKKQSFYRALWEDHGPDWDNWKKSMAVYYGFISYIDHQIGRLVEELERQDILNDTLVIYTSDHGEMMGSHGLWHKMQAYEESIRVPLLFSAPWIAPGKQSQVAAGLLDLAPTILSQNGYDIPGCYEGRDLSPWLAVPDAPEGERYVFAEQKPLGRFHKETDWRMVKDHRYKYIWNRGDRDELYDLTLDPSETENLSGREEASGIEKRLVHALSRWMKRSGDPLEEEMKRVV